MMVGPSRPAVAWPFAAALLETKAARRSRTSRRGCGPPKRVHSVFPPRARGWSYVRRGRSQPNWRLRGPSQTSS